MDKPEALQHIRAVRAAFDAAVESIPFERMDEPMTDGGWSAKDEIAHVTFYDRRLSGRLRGLARGEEPRHAESYDHLEAMPPFETLDSFNSAIRGRYASIPARDVVDASRNAFADMLAALETLPNEHWNQPAPFTAGRTVAGFIPGTTWVHYARHLPPLEVFITTL